MRPCWNRAGEGGRMVAPPAVACAIEDAMRPLRGCVSIDGRLRGPGCVR